jgi:hypothetical protein
MAIMIFVCERCDHHNRIPYTRIAKRKLKVKRKPKGEQILHEFITETFTLLSEPKSKYELSMLIPTSYPIVQSFLDKHLKLGNIQPLEFNPNKYILTTRGKRILYLLKTLNSFITIWQSDIKLPMEKAGRT